MRSLSTTFMILISHPEQTQKPGQDLNKKWCSWQDSTVTSKVTHEVMSGPICTLLGLTRMHLQGYVHNTFLAYIHYSWHLFGRTWRKKKVDFMKSNTSLLKRCNDDWMTLLREVKGDLKKKEEKEYLWATEGGWRGHH